ncbi:hypothetical protein DICPUDRAFT_158384 [Dictyostelium purpureum]|uniref:MD-2-related lipid-recognition domain-containing protein n=1 Tax=Dictyostelium purpureum TaxID=5786 RepID=F1A1H5_DICPU|nr:uncharacterized protein DICPUDRAFT_158384 [Dictyostelium purpureum]EGC29960.1 hypothetical protein DICPUDRAFT_158384 [Dictyostelium purpureum]|eukprot:XP_003293520.1 hypothetical protein DICPUDRAFT_158384 [Dictyostelium purpureum]
MKVILSLVLILSIIFGLSQSQQIWDYCSDNNNALFDIQTLTATPNPPIIGKPVVVNLNGNLESDVTAGSSTFSLQYYIAGAWRNLPTFTNDVCSIVSCPVKAGPFQFNTTINVPIITPPGQYRGSLQLVDQSQQNIACLVFNTTMGYSFDY